jgi:hypothetical protein
MSKSREIPGLADAMALIVGPALITTMIVALAFFLIEVFYGGEYSGRMRWTIFFYVLGCVLVARLAIEFGDSRASLYALGLGAAAFLAMQRFVRFPPGWMQDFGPILNIGLLALVWWWARQLTWDCTHFDPQRDASDRSVLQAAGIDPLSSPSDSRSLQEDVDAPNESKPLGVLERFQRWRQQRQKQPHTPGVWVVYFGLAALPIFGLGQSLIPVDDRPRRIFSFVMMVLYVASAMGLLMTTAFLGLRRYLQERNVRIPAKLAGLWLGLGAAMIGGFLLVAAILPRPASETPLVDVSAIITSSERSASRHAVRREGQGQGDGAAGQQVSEKAASKASASGKSDESGRGRGEDNSRHGQGDDRGQGGERGQSSQRGSQPRGSPARDHGSARPGRPTDSDARTDERPAAGRSDRTQDQADSRRSSSDARSRSAGSAPGPWSLESLGVVGRILKWLVFALLALVFALFLFRRGLSILAPFSDWAKALLDFWNQFWARLFGGRSTAGQGEDFGAAPDLADPLPTFASFRNPFASGQARHWSNAQLVQYSFAALEAWARESGYPRTIDETPLEFARRLGEAHPPWRRTVSALAALYARLAYSQTDLPRSAPEIVADLWASLEASRTRTATVG